MLLFGFRALPTYAAKARRPSTHRQHRAHGHRVVELCATSCYLAFVASAAATLDVVLKPLLLAAATIDADHRGDTLTDDSIHLTTHEFSCQDAACTAQRAGAQPRHAISHR